MGSGIIQYDPMMSIRQSIQKSGIFVRYFQPVISGTFLKLSEVCKCSKYLSGSQLSNGTQHLGLRITLWDPRVILRGGVLRCVILMTEMILGGDSYEKSCWKWSGRHSVTTIRVWNITLAILEVILGVVWVILMTDMILGGDSYEKSCWKWSGMHSLTTIWVWDMTLEILEVYLSGWENNYLKVQNKYNFEINKSLFIFVH